MAQADSKFTLLFASAFACLFLFASPAGAMTPAFDLDIHRVGDYAIRVTARFDSVPQGFNWASLEASGVLSREMVGLLPTGDVDPYGRPKANVQPIYVSLERVDVGVYMGRVSVEEPGTWAVVPWPNSSLAEPYYASTLYFSTPWRAPIAPWLIAGGVAAATSMLLVFAVRKRDRSRQLHP